MPARDGTGPLGQGPAVGGRRPRRGQRMTTKCVCPKCDYSEAHVRGIPCVEKKCPKCDTPLRGSQCR